MTTPTPDEPLELGEPDSLAGTFIDQINTLKRELDAARAELASVKAHAEAMAKELEAIRDLDGYYFSAVTGIVEAYRRDFPKDAP